jgi:hypothetical protein
MAKLNNTIPDGDLRAPRHQVAEARLVVAGRVADPDTAEVTPAEVDLLRELLSMLGLRDTKVCGTCREEKPLADFHRVPARWDGRDGRCSECKQTAIEARRPKPGAYDVADLAQMPESELSTVLAAGGAPNP